MWRRTEQPEKPWVFRRKRQDVGKFGRSNFLIPQNCLCHWETKLQDSPFLEGTNLHEKCVVQMKLLAEFEIYEALKKKPLPVLP